MGNDQKKRRAQISISVVASSAMVILVALFGFTFQSLGQVSASAEEAKQQTANLSQSVTQSIGELKSSVDVQEERSKWIMAALAKQTGYPLPTSTQIGSGEAHTP